jgi:hypothetical protein
MPTFTPVEDDPFAPRQGQGLVGRQTRGPDTPKRAPTLTPVDHDPFDPAQQAQSAAQTFRRLPGDSAQARPPAGPSMTGTRGHVFGQPVDEFVGQISGAPAKLYQADQEYQIAARQSTDLEVRKPDGNYARPVLGKAYQLDDGNVYFDDPQGRPVQADKAKHVVLRDPQTNEQMVFARTPDTDQNRLLSLGQVLTPGLVTGPVSGVSRAAGPTRAGQAAQRVADLERDAAAFDRSGVRPFGPAFSSGPVAATAKQITEVPVLGAPTRNALEESLTGARDASRDVAGRYGVSTTAREAGQVVQEGIERFKDARPADVVGDAAGAMSDARVSSVIAAPARETSLKTKQAALYERAWRRIPEEMRRGRAVEGEARVMQAPSNARAVLEDIAGRMGRMTQQSGKNAVDKGSLRPAAGHLGQIIDAVRNPRWTANLQTLREMRSEFRRLASGMGDTEKNVLKHSDLDRIQGAITEDMIALLQRNADRARETQNHALANDFERSIREFRRADQFTRLSMQRLESIERLFKADSAESLARNILQAALAGGKGNEQMLMTMRRTLRPEEMGEIAAALISEMGRPVGSARGFTQELGFSVNSAMTKWQNMGERQKAILFDGEHRKALDDLVRVWSRLSNVESLANSSRSFSNTLGIGSIGAGAAAVASGMDAMFTAGATAGTIAGASVLFSRPSYVRWVIAYTKAKAAARNPQSAGRLSASLAQLGRMAQADPQLVPVFRALAGDDAEQQE